ncbi:MAG: ATP-binding protein [Candidatus Kapaibacteriota bacterium]
MKSISLRFRLVFWYSAIVTLTLLVFGIAAYLTVSQDLYQNLDASLERVATSLDFIIRKKQKETMQPLRPANQRRKKSRRNQQEIITDSFAFFRNSTSINDTMRVSRSDSAEIYEDPVWSAVYEHILFNPKNYYIQIADLNGQIVWRSDNLDTNTLPLLDESISPNGIPFISTLTTFKGQSQNLRLYRKKTAKAFITVGYSLEEIDSTLYELFNALLIGFPIVLFISTLGGFILARISLKPIDDLSRSAREITASNLSNRLPEPKTNDEVARLTHTLNDMIARLEDSFNQIKQFTADVSHELRTPLAILTGELEVALRSDKSPEEYQSLLISALEEVGRLSKVVRTLLDLSRAETGQVTIEHTNVNLSTMLDDLSEDAMILAEERSISVGSMIEPGIVIDGDSVRLHQALLNIVDNAIKYTPSGGDILMRLVKEGDRAILRVSDTGVGIAKEHLPHIFDRFFRADQARSQDIQGNGLGLSIVKWIIEAHEGTIRAESTPGKGTMITIVLPILENPQQNNEHPPTFYGRNPYS